MIHSGRREFAVFSPDGRRIVTASWDKSARIWDAATGKSDRLDVADMRKGGVRRVSEDSRYVLNACVTIPPRVWNASTGKQVACIRPGGHVAHAAFSPDSRQVVTATSGDDVNDNLTSYVSYRAPGEREYGTQ